MRYIQKNFTPLSFIQKTHSLIKWDDYHNCCLGQKRALKKYILKYEQNYLCIYCENKVNLNNSHIEHIKPKARTKYPQFTFAYFNLAVSCNGTCNNLENDSTEYSCGHIKENEYDDFKFLNPVQLKDIRDYFEYDIDEGKVQPSSKDIPKSIYMIDTLHLNDGRLPLARQKALKNFIKKMKRIKDKNIRKEKTIEILNKEDNTQISFLRFRFKNLL